MDRSRAKGTWTIAVIGTGYGRYSVVVVAPVDNDKDGFAAPVDCDDAKKAISPAAKELCANKIDDNCDGLVDAKDPSCAAGAVACPDADKDGWADCGVVGCQKTTQCGDCDDSDSAVNPGEKEDSATGLSCLDGRDNDCDGAVDLGAKACATKVGSASGSDVLAKAVKLAMAEAGAGSDADAGSDAGSDAGAGSESGLDTESMSDVVAAGWSGPGPTAKDEGCGAARTGRAGGGFGALGLFMLLAIAVRRRADPS